MGPFFLGLRLEGKLSFEANPMGDIDEDVWVVNTSDDVVEESSKQKLSAAVRKRHPSELCSSQSRSLIAIEVFIEGGAWSLAKGD